MRPPLLSGVNRPGQVRQRCGRGRRASADSHVQEFLELAGESRESFREARA